MLVFSTTRKVPGNLSSSRKSLDFSRREQIRGIISATQQPTNYKSFRKAWDSETRRTARELRPNLQAVTNEFQFLRYLRSSGGGPGLFVDRILLLIHPWDLQEAAAVAVQESIFIYKASWNKKSLVIV